MAQGATTRAKALTLNDQSKDNMADSAKHDETQLKECVPAIFKTPAKNKERNERMENISKGDKSKEKVKTVKARMPKNKNNKVSANSGQSGMDEYFQQKGFVAGMINHINSTPPNSPPKPVAGSQTKKKMLAIKNGQLSVEEDDMDQCFQGENYHDYTSDHDQHQLQNDHNEQILTENEEEDDEEPQALTDILRQLNSTVKQLEKSVRRMDMKNEEIEKKVSTVEVVQSQDSARMRGIINSLDDQQDKIDMLIGIVEKQDIQIQALKNRWDTAYAKETKDNIIINGLTETQGENCYHEVNNFMKNVLKTEKQIQLQSAKRIGKGQNKAILAKLKNVDDRAEIYKKVGNLKQANRGRTKPYFISDQLPESWAEKKRYIHFIKKQNQKLPPQQQANATVEKGELSLDGVPFKQPIQALTPKEQCNIRPERKATLRQLKIKEGTTETVGGSKFTGYAAEIFSADQAQNFYDALRMRVPDATHIACAFLIPGTNIAKMQGSIDDGEHGAGRTLINLLYKYKGYNRMVLITRHYGGMHIGATRFSIMERVAESALKELNDEIAKKSGPLNDEELRQLNIEIQQQAEQKRLELEEKKKNPWFTENNSLEQEEWSNTPTP